MKQREGTAFAYFRLAVLTIVLGGVYGAVMGTYDLSSDRTTQILFSAIKVPLLLAGTFAICLPSFFVFNTLLGLRNDFPAAARAVMTSQAALTAVLASLAPYTAFIYFNTNYYRAAVMFNGLMFGIAIIAAQMVLLRLYRPLIAWNERHRVLVLMWLLMYVFVGIQVAWILRPFIGNPGMDVQFVRTESFENAYVGLANMIANFFKSVFGT